MKQGLLPMAAAMLSLGITVVSCGPSTTSSGSALVTPVATPVVAQGTAVHGVAMIFVANRVATSASKRRPSFVSPSSSSAGVVVNGGTPAYTDVSPSASVCTTATGGRTCSIPITAPAGADTFVITLYDAANGTGTTLGVGTASQTVVAGQSFTVTVTLNPVVGSVTSPVFTFASGTAFAAGTAGTATVAFTLLDPDGNVIAPAATPMFAAPLTLTSSDAHVTVTPATWTGPTQTVTLTYDGSATVSPSVTVTVSASSTAIGTAVTAPVFNYLVSTLAGSGAAGAADGTGASATFNAPYGLAVDPAGNVYVADTHNEKIRKITPAGVVTTIAGSGAQGSADGPAANATFSTPFGVAADAAGNVYVADHDNNKIRVISAAGVVSTLAGTGAAGATDGPGATATFSGPRGITVDASGNVYVSEIELNGQKIRKVTPAGVVSTIAGSGAAGDMDGPAATATFAGPSGVTLDANGNIFVPDANNNKIREVTTTGIVSTFAGTGLITTPVMDGPAATATFDHPDGTAFDARGNLFVADATSNRIRMITPGQIVSTVVGAAGQGAVDGPGGTATFNGPIGVAIDPSGNIYVADLNNNKIRKIVP